MKAIQITEPSVMKVVEIEKPLCGSGEVLLRVQYVGFCGSDLNTYRGLNPMVQLPVVPGHDIGAVIDQVGADVPQQLVKGMADSWERCGRADIC